MSTVIMATECFTLEWIRAIPLRASESTNEDKNESFPLIFSFISHWSSLSSWIGCFIPGSSFYFPSLPHKYMRIFSGSVLKKESRSELDNEIDSPVFKVLSSWHDPGLRSLKMLIFWEILVTILKVQLSSAEHWLEINAVYIFWIAFYKIIQIIILVTCLIL